MRRALPIALLASMAVGSMLMLVVGASPGHVWWQMIERVSTSEYQLGQVLYKATGLALTGLAVSIALDAGLFNIGGEAQLGAGIFACALVGTALPAGTPAVLAIPLCTLAAAAAGGAIGGAIGLLRAKRDAHEVITSFMFNAIVAGVVLVEGSAHIFQGGTTTGPAIVPGAQLPRLPLGGSAANYALFIAAGAVAFVWWLRARTTWGQAWLAVGRDPEAARHVGISVERVQIYVMAGAGALAGLAATSFVMGHKHALEQGLGAGTGLLGIVAALLGRLDPLGVGLASLFLAFLSVGGLAVADLVPKELTEMLLGVVLLAVATAAAWERR
ncbi:MAG TPA: ABC transporter permease [Kofleriaceae bacterium]|nr:ABC transporter permease [Kofleriaceae bacterium]